MSADFSEWSVASTTFDGTRNALRQQEPPRNDVAVPCVDDDFHVLIEQIAFDDGDVQSNLPSDLFFATVDPPNCRSAWIYGICS